MKSLPIEIRCDGGCGRIQRVRKQRILPAMWYICTWGGICETRLPPKHPGLVRSTEFNAAGSFYGITDRIPSEEERQSMGRAKALLDAALDRIGSQQ